MSSSTPPPSEIPSAARWAGGLQVMLGLLTLGMAVWALVLMVPLFADAHDSKLLRVFTFGVSGAAWVFFGLIALLMLGVVVLFVRNGIRVARGSLESAARARPVALVLALLFGGIVLLAIATAVVDGGLEESDYLGVAIFVAYAMLATAARHCLDLAASPSDG